MTFKGPLQHKPFCDTMKLIRSSFLSLICLKHLAFIFAGWFCTVFCPNARLICLWRAFGGAPPPPPSKSSAGAREQVLQGSLRKKQSWSELKNILVLFPRHSISRWVFACLQLVRNIQLILSIKMSKWGNRSSSALQGWLTTADRSFRMSVAQPQPPSWQGQLVCTELHDTVLGRLPCLVLPVQGQTRHSYTSPRQQ